MSKIKSMGRMHISQDHLKNLCLSAAAGGFIGMAAALFLAPKTGRGLRKQIVRTYEDLSEKGQDFAEDVLERGQNAVSAATGYAGALKSTLLGKVSNGSNTNLNLLIGAIGGGVLGAAAVMMLASADSEENTLNGITHRIKEAGKGIHWVDAARDIMDTIKNKVYHSNELADEEESGSEHPVLHDVLDWATLGLRVWQNIKTKR